MCLRVYKCVVGASSYHRCSRSFKLTYICWNCTDYLGVVRFLLVLQAVDVFGWCDGHWECNDFTLKEWCFVLYVGDVWLVLIGSFRVSRFDQLSWSDRPFIIWSKVHVRFIFWYILITRGPHTFDVLINWWCVRPILDQFHSVQVIPNILMWNIFLLQ